MARVDGYWLCWGFKASSSALLGINLLVSHVNTSPCARINQTSVCL